MDGLENSTIQNFNSIKVRLERGIVDGINKSISEFQFHKGTIRTTTHTLCIVGI